MSLEWVQAFMPLITGIIVSIFGFLIAKWYERSKAGRLIRESLVKDLTELEKSSFELSREWNKWVDVLLYLQEMGEEREDTQLQEDRIYDTFIEFNVRLNSLFGRLKIYIKWPVEYKFAKKIDPEAGKSDPSIKAYAIFIKIANGMQSSINTKKIIKEHEQIKQYFLDMNLVLNSFYPDILSGKVKT